MRNRILIGTLSTVVLGILLYSFVGTGGQQNYIDSINARRAETDEFMKTSEESPFVESAIDYEGLKYFDANPDFRILANLELLDANKIRRVPTSDGSEKMYYEYGYAVFDLLGRENRLLILKMVGGIEHIFIPFADSTSGDQTYGGGRYLEIDDWRTDKAVLDFNNAYNPYCAYSETYSCPLPPAENYLAIAIAAGEKNYD